MFERLFGGRETDPAIAERIPPGQYKTDKFPVLHYGSVPRTDLATWDFKVYGEVDNPFTLTWDEFKALPRKKVHTDIHCVTRWTKLDTDWEGVPIQEILELAQVRPTATHVVSHAEQGYTANVPLRPGRRRRPPRRHVRRRSRWSWSTATRSGSSSRRSTSGRAASGSAASSSSTTTSWASGSATATTTARIPGRKSASASSRPRHRVR